MDDILTPFSRAVKNRGASFLELVAVTEEIVEGSRMVTVETGVHRRIIAIEHVIDAQADLAVLIGRIRCVPCREQIGLDRKRRIARRKNYTTRQIGCRQG